MAKSSHTRVFHRCGFAAISGVFSLVVGATAFGVPRHVLADPAAPTTTAAPLADTLKGPAKEAYEDGKRVHDLKDFAGAAIKFKVAYELSGDIRLLKNIASCERSLLHYAEAYNTLTKYLAAGAGKIPADQLASTEATMTALKTFFSFVTVQVEPIGATIFVDAVEVGKSPLAPFGVDLGNHKVYVTASGYEPAERVLLVPGKTEMSVAFALKRLAIVDKGALLAKLTVSAGSSDAISIDGKPVTLGKYEGELAPGPHTIRITHPGKKQYESKVDLTAGATRSVEATLVDESSGGVPAWLWITGGAVVASGLAVGGYFLFKPGEESGTKLVAELGTVSLKLFQGVRF